MPLCPKRLNEHHCAGRGNDELSPPACGIIEAVEIDTWIKFRRLRDWKSQLQLIKSVRLENDDLHLAPPTSQTSIITLHHWQGVGQLNPSWSRAIKKRGCLPPSLRLEDDSTRKRVLYPKALSPILLLKPIGITCDEWYMMRLQSCSRYNELLKRYWLLKGFVCAEKDLKLFQFWVLQATSAEKPIQDKYIILCYSCSIDLARVWRIPRTV